MSLRRSEVVSRTYPACILDPKFSRYIVRTGADSTLINGLGRSAGTAEADLAVISVTQGKR